LSKKVLNPKIERKPLNPKNISKKTNSSLNFLLPTSYAYFSSSFFLLASLFPKEIKHKNQGVKHKSLGMHKNIILHLLEKQDIGAW
jgi:hypothetical protein